MNQFYDRFESTLKQALRAPGADGGQKPSDAEVSSHAGLLTRYMIGCLHQFAKSGFTKKPTESYAAQRRFLAA
jgi:TetR/AcrR family transcriptional regulator